MRIEDLARDLQSRAFRSTNKVANRKRRKQMKVNSLEELFVQELKDIYDAERQITKALPKMIKMASEEELRNALESHLQETEKQMERLDQCFEELGAKPARKRCEGMHGVIEEGNQMLSEIGDPSAKDAAIICAAQKVEHYEMASYGCLRTWAEVLGYSNVASLLQETLDEEGEADKKLTSIAGTLNLRAVGVESEE
jgi:ferritin-like metal-binding protein YciE